jgi:hypothetical protein
MDETDEPGSHGHPWSTERHYLAMAAECQARAAHMGDPTIRALWTDLAHSWEMLARHAAQHRG